MRKSIVSTLALSTLLVCAVATAQQNWPFGPQRLVQQGGTPAEQVFRFPAAVGAATLRVTNGDTNGRHRVSSAVVKVNGQTWIRPSDLNQNVSQVVRSGPVAVDNTLSVDLKSAPGGYVTVHIVQEAAFKEDSPNWSRADLAVTAFTATPDRVPPGTQVSLQAFVENLAARGSGTANLVFEIDGELVARIPTGQLDSLSGLPLAAQTTVATPGRHTTVARLEILPGTMDRGLSNNRREATVYVSGEAMPRPELTFDAIDFDASQLSAGEAAVIPVTLRNPSFASTGPVRVYALLDNTLIKLSGSDIDDPSLVFSVAPGESRTIQVPLSPLLAGQHRLQFALVLPDAFPDALAQANKVWDFMVNGMAALCATPLPHAWRSLGPRTIVEPTNSLPSGSVGRIDAIAFHPTDPNVMYTGAPSGGVWKSTNRGGSWSPVGDGLASLNVSALAVDPNDPRIVYASTTDLNHYGSPGGGIVKSINGGASWSAFATPNAVGDVREMIVRYLGPGWFVIYAASSKGLLRYLGTDPLAQKSADSDWPVIKKGEPWDIAVHPTDPNLVYASLFRRGTAPGSWRFDGLWRTDIGMTATQETDWDPLTSGLPDSTGRRLLTIDLWAADPRILFAAVNNPAGTGAESDPVLAIYRSGDGGGSWTLASSYTESDVEGSMYNPFIRVHPKMPLVYFGGVKLFKQYFDNIYPWDVRQVVGVHDDMKEMQFDPFDPDYYYVTSDGGIWRCLSQVFESDWCTHRNTDLRVTQFFDIDSSRNDPALMVGGAQDNGISLYSGAPDWTSIKGGDGNMALIASADNQTIYAQYQFLSDKYGTARCMKGAMCSWSDWASAKDGLPVEGRWHSYPDGTNEAWITARPDASDGMSILSEGDEVYSTQDGGASWQPVGPSGANVKGYVRRVLSQPQTGYWVAGTSDGQVWYRTSPSGAWTLLFEHPCLNGTWKCTAPVISMAFAPTDHMKLYVAFDIDGSRAYTRIWRFVMNPGPPVVWSPSNITENFPENLDIRVISGDGHDADVAHVGTNRGGVYRWLDSRPSYDGWRSHNLCLPGAVDVRDLLIAPDRTLRAGTWGRGAWTVQTGP